MNVRYCSVCSTSFDVDVEGCEGLIGLIPFAFCHTCRSGIWEWAQISFDLVPNPASWEPVPIRCHANISMSGKACDRDATHILNTGTRLTFWCKRHNKGMHGLTPIEEWRKE